MTKYRVENSQNEKNIKKERDVLKTKGVGGTNQREPIPIFNSTPREAVFSNKNSWIILGGDRSSSPISGQAGQGATQAHSIDLVVGRGQNVPTGQPPDNDKSLDPNFFEDAARIYLTSKGDVDNYFGLAEGARGDFMASTEKSGAGIKADHVRLVGREGIKIVTGRGKTSACSKAPPCSGVIQTEKNSLGQEIEKVGKIEFIAGNYTQSDTGVPNDDDKIIQPLAKGENLVECLQEIQAILVEILGKVQSNTRDLMVLNGVVAPLAAPFNQPGAVLCATNAVKELVNFSSMFGTNQNLIALKINYLERCKGNKYINSEYVFTT